MTGTRRKAADAETRDAVPPEELLRRSPFEGDLTEELAAAEPRPRRRPPSATVILGAAVLIVGGFVGGVQADRHWGAKKQPDVASLMNRFASRAGGRGGGGGAFAGSPFGGASGGGAASAGGAGGTTGTVQLVDGNVLYVKTSTGIVRVQTNGSTKVGVTKKARLKDLKAGTPVVVQGAPGRNGTMTATSVTQNR